MVVNFSQEEKKQNDTQEKDAKTILEKIDTFLLKFTRIPLKEKLFFVRHLGLMLKSGISLSTALQTLAKQTDNKYFQKILIEISGAIVNHGVVSGIITIFFIAFLIWGLKTYRGKYIFQSALLVLPIISPIIKKINLARFARNISSLLKTDIMIIRAFQITANVLGNIHYRNALLAMAQEIKKGGKISEVVSNYPKLFTPVVTSMIAVGEETGELDNILIELAEFYEEEVDQIMENLPSII